MEKPRYKDIRAALYELKAVQFALNSELEENGGEVTESIAYKEKTLASIRYMLKNGGVDHLARLPQTSAEEE